MIALLIAAILPMTEMQTIKEVANEYGLTREQTAILVAIRKTENGKKGLEFGVAQNFPNHPARRYKDGKKSFKVQAQWAAGTIKRRYNGNLPALAKRYCPPNPINWEKMVRFYMEKAIKEV